MEFCERHRGSITVFLSFIVLPMMLFAGLMIDFSRIYGAKTIIKGAEDLALNAGLANFDTKLHDNYGIFAVVDDGNLQESLQTYFENTIDGNNLLGVNADGYVQRLLDYLKGQFSTQTEAYSNLIDLELEDFTVNCVEGSQLLYPEPLENQIVEYMKYRGPVSLGYGFLEKMNILSDVQKQSEALKKEVNYERKLNKLQDICIETYEVCSDLIDGTRGWDLQKVKKEVLDGDATMGVAMSYFVLGAGNPEIEPLESFDRINKKADSISEENAFQYLKDYKDGINTEWADICYVLKKARGKIPNGLPLINEMEEVITFFSVYRNNALPIIEKIKGCYEKVKNKDKYKKDDEWDAVEEWYQDSFKKEVESCITASASIQEQIKNHINHITQEYAAKVEGYYKQADTAVNNAKKAKDKLNTLVSKVKDASSAGKEWKTSIDKLNDGEVKKTMNNNYQVQAEDLDLNKVQDLKEKVENMENYFQSIRDELKKISIFGKKLCDAASQDFVKDWSSKVSIQEGMSYTELTSLASSTIASKYITTNFSSISGQYMDIEKDEFYIYLQKLSNVSEVTDTQKEKVVKEKQKEIIKTGNDGAKGAEDIADASIEVNQLPSHSQQTGGSSSNGNISFSQMSSGSNDAMADSAEELLGKTDFLSSLDDILKALQGSGETIRDNLYIMEYAMNMFSYYTTADDAKTLTGKSMTSNPMYRGEIEYLLWGENSKKANVDRTLATIFAIRFVLNSIYAFTNTEIRTSALQLATALVGWTGFGVPIVQSLLILATALGETAWDMEDLKKQEGNDEAKVPIYKTERTWKLKLSNVLNISVETLKTGRPEIIENLSDQLNQLIDEKDVIEKFQNTIEEQMKYNIEATEQLVIDSILTPLQTMIISQLTSLEKVDFDQAVEDFFAQIRQDCNDGSIISQAKIAVINDSSGVIKSNIVKLYDDIKLEIEKSTVPDSTALSNLVLERMSYLKQNLLTINSGITDFFGEAENRITDILQQGGTEIQNNVSKELQKMSEQLGGGVLDSSTGIVNGTDSISNGATLTMNYQDYVKVFLLINLFTQNPGGNQGNTIVKRIADLIQINTGVEMEQAFTLLKTESETAVKTSFIWLPYFNNGVEDYSKKRYLLKSEQIKGY